MRLRCTRPAPSAARRRSALPQSSRCLAAASSDPAAPPALPPLAADSSHPLPCGATVHLFGVGHLGVRPEVGDFILASKPHAVVFETAITPAHGAAHGAVLGAGDLSRSGEAWHATALMLVQHLQASGTGDPATGPLWGRVRAAAPAEQVALVAALVVGSVLVHGDRPKAATARRLARAVPAADLDAALGRQAAGNAAALLQQGCAGEGGEAGEGGGTAAGAAEAADADGEPLDAFDAVVLRERDDVLHVALCGAAEAAGPGGAVVGLLGGAHLAAVAARLRRGDPPPDPPTLADLLADAPAAGYAGAPWRRAQQQQQQQQQQIPGAGGGAAGGDGGLGCPGVRRALAEHLLALRAPGPALGLLREALGPPEAEPWAAAAAAAAAGAAGAADRTGGGAAADDVAAAAAAAAALEGYRGCSEVYASSSMLLACLPHNLLEGVACAPTRGGASLYDRLGPLRALRPSLGGRGWSAGAVEALRAGEAALDERTGVFEAEDAAAAAAAAAAGAAGAGGVGR